jgi:uncharacterized protein (DUF433 family)
MSLLLDPQPVPLTQVDGGVIRVGGTRVTLDTVVGAFLAGSTPEEIVLGYPSLSLEDVYATVAYYLRHRADVDAYLAERSAARAAAQAEAERRLDPVGIRARLLARQAERQ